MERSTERTVAMSRFLTKKLLLIFAIVCVASFQVYRIGQQTLRLISTKVRPNLHLDAVSRSADVSYGQGYLESTQILRDEIPSTATVILTGTTSLPQYEAFDFMQYFLFPRTVQTLACPGNPIWDRCVQLLSGPGVYFIVGDIQLSGTNLSDNHNVIPLGTGVSLLTSNLTKE